MLENEVTVMFLNTLGHRGNVTTLVKNFLQYVNDHVPIYCTGKWFRNKGITSFFHDFTNCLQKCTLFDFLTFDKATLYQVKY